MGEVEILLPKLPDPAPPDGFTLSGWAVGFDGMGEEEGEEEETLEASKSALERKMGGRFEVYAHCNGNTEETKHDEQYCRWLPMKRSWSAWQYI